MGLHMLKDKIKEIAITHPKLGIGNVVVPSFLVLLKEKLGEIQQEKKYMSWQDYKELCQSIGILL